MAVTFQTESNWITLDSWFSALFEVSSPSKFSKYHMSDQPKEKKLWY